MKAINWNRVPDPLDKTVWDRLTTNFWLPEKIAVSNDLDSWRKLTDAERDTIKKVFVSLTMLDTLQAEYGAPSLIEELGDDQHAQAVLSNIQFMEAFTGETELLTEHGWAPIRTIDGSVKVAQYEPNKRVFEFVEPRVVPPHKAEKIYRIQSADGTTTQRVSPNHRVMLRQWDEETSTSNVTTVPAKHFAEQAEGLIMVGEAPPHGVAPRMPAYDRLRLVLYLSEEKPGGVWEFWCTTDEELDQLVDLCDAADVTLTVKQFGSLYQCHIITGGEHRPGATLRETFPGMDKPQQWCEQFIRDLWLWGGYRPTEPWLGYTREEADFVSAVALLAHRSVSVFESATGVFYIEATTFGQYKPVEDFDVVEQPGETVYCVQVPSTFLVTRNGVTPVITGNCVHAKSYSTIFSTLCSTEEIDELFRWSEFDTKLQAQADTIISQYLQCDEPGMRFAASVFLESVLFYTGFFAPLKLAAEGKLTNTADIIRLIMRDEGVHGFYIGAKAQQLDLVHPLEADIFNLLKELLEVEYRRCEQLYDEVGWTEEVKNFLRYNANKALANLGMAPLFPAHETQIPPYILAALDIGTGESHDFFSGAGASYVMGKAEETTEEDWDW